jgi:group I intron endonuclease
LDNIEINLIKEYNSISPNRYNLDSRGNKNKHLSEETKKKISESKKGEKNPFYGKHLSKITRTKMSDVRTGEKNGMFGKKHSAETIAKLSNMKKGKEPWNKGLKLKQ